MGIESTQFIKNTTGRLRCIVWEKLFNMSTCLWRMQLRCVAVERRWAGEHSIESHQSPLVSQWAHFIWCLTTNSLLLCTEQLIFLFFVTSALIADPGWDHISLVDACFHITAKIRFGHSRSIWYSSRLIRPYARRRMLIPQAGLIKNSLRAIELLFLQINLQLFSCWIFCWIWLKFRVFQGKLEN